MRQCPLCTAKHEPIHQMFIVSHGAPMSERTFYLADAHDRIRLATTGHIEASNDCQPWYFSSKQSALDHPAADGLMVHSCPVAETIPGLPSGAVCAEDVLARLDPCALGSIAQEVAKLCSR